MKDASSHRAEAETLEEDAAGAPDPTIERLLEHVAVAPAMPDAAPPLRTARVVSLQGGGVQIAWRGRREVIEAELDDGVDAELVKQAMDAGDRVLVEIDPTVGPVVVGVVQRRIPTKMEIRGETVVIEAEREILLRTGRGAMRIREDGDIEVVGSRISTMSRGLFRIVGRVLRLN
jgi:hypothetical protein